MPRTGLQSGVLKDKAIDTAERLICQNGVERLRLTDVARKLKVSHAALYNHFEDRQALLDAVSKRWLDRIDAELSEIAGRSDAPEVRLTAWFLALHRLKREKILADPELYEAFDHSVKSARPFVENHLKTAMQLLTSIVEEAMSTGLIRKGDSAGVASLLFEATAAFHHPRLVMDGIGRDRTPALRKLIKVLLAGLQ